jgi:hypothetical protein
MTADNAIPVSFLFIIFFLSLSFFIDCEAGEANSDYLVGLSFLYLLQERKNAVSSRDDVNRGTTLVAGSYDPTSLTFNAGIRSSLLVFQEDFSQMRFF